MKAATLCLNALHTWLILSRACRARAAAMDPELPRGETDGGTENDVAMPAVVAAAGSTAACAGVGSGVVGISTGCAGRPSASTFGLGTSAPPPPPEPRHVSVNVSLPCGTASRARVSLSTSRLSSGSSSIGSSPDGKNHVWREVPLKSI